MQPEEPTELPIPSDIEPAKEKLFDGADDNLKNRWKMLKRIYFYETDLRFSKLLIFLFAYKLRMGHFFRCVITALIEQDEDFWKWLNKHKQEEYNRVGVECKKMKEEIVRLGMNNTDFETSISTIPDESEPLTEMEVEELFSILDDEEFDWQ